MTKRFSNGLKTRLYQGLTIIVSTLMAISFAMPWWSCVLSSDNWIHIYGWGLRHTMKNLATYIAQDITPSYQIKLAWVYLIVCIVLIILSALKLNKKNYLPTIMLVIVGLSYMAYTYVAGFMVIANRVKVFHISLQGQTSWNFSGLELTFHSNFNMGYYLAFAAGFLCIVLALMRIFIMRSLNPNRKAKYHSN